MAAEANAPKGMTDLRDIFIGDPLRGLRQPGPSWRPVTGRLEKYRHAI
jgi:hypothetical protein